MKITNSRPVATKRKISGKNNLSGDSDVFSIDENADTANMASSVKIGKPASIGDISTLLAVQGEAVGAHQSEVVDRGFGILDALDDLKLDVLSGSVSRRKLLNLAALVNRQGSKAEDPALMNILDHIELRARVELAKFDQNRRKHPW